MYEDCFERPTQRERFLPPVPTKPEKFAQQHADGNGVKKPFQVSTMAKSRLAR